MAYCVMPRALAFFSDLTVSEEALKKFVCVRIGPAGIFRDSHSVAFLEKVMGGQGTSVLAHRRIPLNALSVLPLFCRQFKSFVRQRVVYYGHSHLTSAISPLKCWPIGQS